MGEADDVDCLILIQLGILVSSAVQPQCNSSITLLLLCLSALKLFILFYLFIYLFIYFCRYREHTDKIKLLHKEKLHYQD